MSDSLLLASTSLKRKLKETRTTEYFDNLIMDQDNGSTLKLLCWNIDGLDKNDLKERTEAVLATILSKQPDVVLLQEVVEHSLNVFQSRCEGYNVFCGHQSHHNFHYFNAILIRSSTINTQNTKLEYFPFENSVQGRHFLLLPIRFAGSDIILITSHLESYNSSSTERKGQFRDILLYMRKRRNESNVIFGGDTNLQDSEVEAVGGLPEEVFDAWQSCGSPHDAKFTWDMSENNNRAMPGGDTPKLRLDRIFLRPAQNGNGVKPQMFTLIGKQRLRCGRFASDHWGIWMEFNCD